MPPGEERTRFVADAMLGSLARKLRALGFETSYYKAGDDSGLLGIARSENRIVLTADRALASRADALHLSVMQLAGKKDSRRVREIAESAKRMGIGLRRGDPLCSVCGGRLDAMKRAAVAGKVPRSVENRHRLFFKCATCGKHYWRGSHWKKLRSLSRLLEEK
ncbi:MAG: hypothetical protein JRM82_02490 [Nitrososphaerota archaeon]|nr:hypothetical protein [Nitrososphaerota archaeon]